MIWNDIQEVVDDITEAFPTTQVYPSLGNHDAYPCDHVKAPPTEVRFFFFAANNIYYILHNSVL